MWARTTVVLECGCEGAGAWNVDWPGDEQKCSRHGRSAIHRISRVSTPTPSRDAKLGVKT
jgi:hypothetical protein